MKTSLKLSKWLQDNGFDGESEYWRINNNEEMVKGKPHKAFLERNNCYKTYDILNDLCCKYAKEMFGEDKKLFKIYPDRNKKIWLLNYEGVSHTVLLLLQQNKKDEAEKYIMKVSILNPKNKL